MALWSVTADSGILRKNKPKDNFEDLLVFGYACKLFRDDEKASYIDKGKHLIPWMGNDNLKIDRYDCRGALSDLSIYEASKEGFDTTRWLGLSDSERKLEQLCDKERYYSLQINEEEEQMYKEEEQKRLKTNEYQYSYDVPAEPASEANQNVQMKEEEEEEFVPPPSLDVPVDIKIPKTVKENARIEKTALFVCKQGPQMEILIKAKQSDNPQFSFLNQQDPLYKYYRHVLSAIKSGRYQVISKSEETDKSQEIGAEDHYLHPSLLSNTPQSEVQSSSIPAIPYKPSANCAYSQLVNRIQGGQPSDGSSELAKADQQQQYYQYYYAAQYYEYYKHCQQSNDPQGSANLMDQNVQNYIQQMAYAQYMQQQAANSSNPYAQIVSNVNKDVSNPYSALLANIQQTIPIKNDDAIKSEELIDKSSSNDRKVGLSFLAQYGSGSDTENDEEETEESFLIPIGESRVVIDKMASYVTKNGDKFEEIVRAKGDPRFEFLNKSHEHHAYYKSKIRECRKSPETKEVCIEKEKSLGKQKEKKVIAPVCFSIKKPKEDAPKEIKSALPLEESDDENEEAQPNSQSDQLPERTPTINCEATNKDSDNSNSNETPIDVNSQQINNGIFDADDPILEMIDLTDDSEERKDAKRAEDKIKDKLAAAAREKLASVARDRALQLERKRKAAAFLKLKSAETNQNESKIVTKIEESDKELTPPLKSNNKSTESEIKSVRISKIDDEVVQIGDSDSDGKEIDTKNRKKSSRKKKSHKRKRSRSKYESRSRKKSKRKHRRSESCSSSDSRCS